jgi:hypothetical protein
VYRFAAQPAEPGPKGEGISFLVVMHGGEFRFACSSQSLEVARVLWRGDRHLLVTDFCWRLRSVFKVITLRSHLVREFAQMSIE